MKEINIGVGFDNVKFGITRDELKEILGKPDEIEKFSYSESEDDLTEVWHYDTHELSASFDEDEDWCLSMLATSSPEFSLGGFKLVGLSKDEVIGKISDLSLGEMIEEDWSTEDSSNHKLLSFDSSSLNLWFDRDHLSEIQWGPLVDDDYDDIMEID